MPLLDLIPAAQPFSVAGGVIADLEDAVVSELSKQFPDLLIDDLAAEASQVNTIKVSKAKMSGNCAKAVPAWNHEQSGASWFKESGIAGRGMRLGVITLNYSYDHPAMAGRIKNIMKFGGAPVQRAVADLHLLHPLGIFGGYEEGRFSGIAPEAEISLAMLSAKPGKADAVLAAIDWLVNQPEPPHAILFCTDFSTPAPSGVARALFACRNAGILPIVAAGNNPNAITGMAALPCTVTIGATDRWQKRALFSGQGPVIYDGMKICKPDFCEPGAAVSGPAEKNEYRLGSGTLQAAAHFAGVYLLMRQSLPETDPEILLNAIKLTAQDLETTGLDDATGYGIPVPSAAIFYVNNPPTDGQNAKLQN
ncbi:MAG TPA: S8 family serine peptidase [Candidatus Rifleibacterium sp.]|nr:S8 family serine peptidase [Candidatus Rifleibacterium sp.]